MARNDEDKIQAAIVEWARVAAPQAVVFAVPNGGLRSKREAAKLKWTGVLAGVPDLCIICLSGGAYFIEVKTPKGVLSPAQKDTIALLEAAGSDVAIARSIDDAREAFARWGIPTREIVT